LDFFTMEWLDGELLSAVLKQFPHRLPRPAAWAILREIAAGLEHAHGRNVVHADLKPQNIMVTKTGEVRIMDFGASSGSARGDSGGQRSKSMAVTPAYASCELLAGRAPDLRDDVFALACLSYELLAGAHPFDYRRATEAREAGIVPQRPPDLSSRQWRALQQGLAWERQDRPISVNDWLEALKPGEGELQGIPRPELDASGAPVKPRAPKILPETYPRLIAGLAALLLVLIGWALWHQPAEPASALPAATFSAPASVPGPRPASVPGPPAGTSFPADEPVKADATPAVAEPAAAEVRTPVPAQSTGPVPRHARAAEHRGPVVDQIGISASAYRVRPDMRFAEIRVQRSIASNARSSFVWWTEDGTGVAGIDYVRQGRSTAYFAPGSLTATLFVKVLANEARQQAATFSVIIGNPTDGAALGNSKARITLLPTRS
jgi:hypothetical protein